MAFLVEYGPAALMGMAFGMAISTGIFGFTLSTVLGVLVGAALLLLSFWVYDRRSQR